MWNSWKPEQNSTKEPETLREESFYTTGMEKNTFQYVGSSYFDVFPADL